jgi:hypothetical protein
MEGRILPSFFMEKRLWDYIEEDLNLYIDPEYGDAYSNESDTIYIWSSVNKEELVGLGETLEEAYESIGELDAEYKITECKTLL